MEIGKKGGGLETTGSDGVRGQGKHTFILFRFDKARKLLREETTSGDTSSLLVCLRLRQDPGRVGEVLYNVASPLLLTLLTHVCLLQRYLDHQQHLTGPRYKLQNSYVSHSRTARSPFHSHRPEHTAAIPIGDINTHPRTQLPPLLCHATWQNANRFAEEPVVWVAELLDLISAAPIWIRKETGTRATGKYVTFPPDQLLTLPSVACTQIHTWVHTPEGRNRKGGVCVCVCREGLARQLCNQVIPSP